MADMSNTVPTYDPWVLSDSLYNTAKWWWAASSYLKAVAFIIGALAIIFPLSSTLVPFVLALFFFLSELSTYRSDLIKSTAQALRRKLDLYDSFGWQIGDTEYADLLVRCPQSVKKATHNKKPAETYFQSKAPQGEKRVLQNLRESAWWSKHLCEKMGRFCLTVMLLTVAISIAALIFTLIGVKDQALYPGIARIITSLLMLLPSLGLVRLALGYYQFGRKAGQTEERAAQLLMADNSDATDAIKIFYEYDIARTTAPMIPNWIWKRNRDDLNTLYNNLYSQKA